MTKIKEVLFIIFLILILLLIIGIIIGSICFIREKKETAKIISDNETVITKLNDDLKDRDNKITDLNNKEPVTIEVIKYLTDQEKEDLILKQQEIINNDTEIIYNLKASLEETNNQLKKQFYPKHDVSLLGLAGLSGNNFNDLNPDCYVGIVYRRSLYIPKIKIKLHIGGGLAGKIYNDYGALGILELGFSF